MDRPYLPVVAPLIELLRSREALWPPTVRETFRQELQVLESCGQLGCLEKTLQRLAALERHLTSTDVTLLHALKEAVQNWLDPQGIT